jgi:hypothetical protein
MLIRQLGGSPNHGQKNGWGTPLPEFIPEKNSFLFYP